jgi:hypothetical protein
MMLSRIGSATAFSTCSKSTSTISGIAALSSACAV